MEDIAAEYVKISCTESICESSELDRLISNTKLQQRAGIHLSKARKGLIFFVAFFLQFSTVGFLYALGVIYTDIIHTTDVKRAQAALVQSLTRGCTAGAGVISGTLVNKYGETRCVFLGTILASSGLLISACSDNIVAVIICTGVITGFGFSLLVIVSVSSTTRIFTENLRPILASLTFGIAMGAVCYPLVFEYLIQFVGWRGSLLIYSGVLLNNLACGIVIHYTMKISDVGLIQRSSERSMFSASVLRNPQYCTFAVCAVFVGMTCLAEIWFLVDDMVINGFKRETGAYFLSVIGIAILISRVINGALLAAIRSKAIQHVIFSLLVMGFSHILFSRLKTYWALFGSSIMYGVGLGIYASLTAVVALDFLGKEQVAIGLGILNTAHGIGNSIGGVLGGHLHDITGSYRWMFDISATVEIAVSFICFLIVTVPKSPKSKCSKSDRIS